jgi:hypothetical protein
MAIRQIMSQPAYSYSYVYVFCLLNVFNGLGLYNAFLVDNRSQPSQINGTFGFQTKLPAVELSSDGRSAVVAPHTSPIPIGLYAMVYVAYSGEKNQFSNMTVSP